MKKPTKQYTHYAIVDDHVAPRSLGVTSKELTPGVFQLVYDPAGNAWLKERTLQTDNLHRLEGDLTSHIISDVEKFLTKETKDLFEEYGMVYKRGYLLYGVPGTGKSATINLVIEEVVKLGGIVIMNPDPMGVASITRKIRQIEPNLLVMVVWEDFEQLCKDESFLSLLDGQDTIDNLLYFGTTNYINKIEANIKDRPSRFARVMEVKAPVKEVRKFFLKKKLKGEHLEHLDNWVKETEGLVIDKIKDVIISVCCFKLTFRDAIDRAKKLDVEVDMTNLIAKPRTTLSKD